jgi:hypothetical protein
MTGGFGAWESEHLPVEHQIGAAAAGGVH